MGEKRYLVFEIKDDSAAGVGGVDLSKVGCFRMHEYRLSGVNSGLDSADTTVLCKITHDSSKVCQIAKKAGTKSSDHILTSSRNAVKKEDNNNNLQSDSAKAEKLTLIDCGDNLDESKTFNSQSLVESNSDISDWPAAPQYNGGVQEVDELGGYFCFDDLGDSFDYLAAADQFGNGFQAFNEFGLEPSFDMNWFTGLLTSDQEEGAVEDISKLGKRRFEEEDSNGSKKMCL